MNMNARRWLFSTAAAAAGRSAIAILVWRRARRGVTGRWPRRPRLGAGGPGAGGRPRHRQTEGGAAIPPRPAALRIVNPHGRQQTTRRRSYDWMRKSLTGSGLDLLCAVSP
jgi:hypothetical protein